MHQGFWARLVTSFAIGNQNVSLLSAPPPSDPLWQSKPRLHLLNETLAGHPFSQAASPTCRSVQRIACKLRVHHSEGTRVHLQGTILVPQVGRCFDLLPLLPAVRARIAKEHWTHLDTVFRASLLKSIRKSLLPMLRGSFPCSVNPTKMLSTRDKQTTELHNHLELIRQGWTTIKFALPC